MSHSCAQLKGRWYVSWLIHMLSDSFICRTTHHTWLNYTWRGDSLICDIFAHSMWHDSWHILHSYMTWLIHMWHICLFYVTWLMTHAAFKCDMTHWYVKWHSYVKWLSRHDWFICDISRRLIDMWHDDSLICDTTHNTAVDIYSTLNKHAWIGIYSIACQHL